MSQSNWRQIIYVIFLNSNTINKGIIDFSYFKQAFLKYIYILIFLSRKGIMFVQRVEFII